MIPPADPTTGEATPLGEQLLAELKRQRIAIVVLFVLLFALAGVGYAKLDTRADEADAQRADAVETHAALCTLRADLAKRVEQGRAFLLEHPKGFADIPAATIRQSLDGQQRTIDALADLECPPDE